MFAKTSIALAILVALSAGALAAQKRHQGAANRRLFAGRTGHVGGNKPHL
jgi:hypothetical protein